MSNRFFLWEPLQGDRCLLSGEESHHFLRVMRGRVGDELTLFDGTGWEGVGQATALVGGRVEIRLIERLEVSREAQGAFDCAVAIPKGRRMETMLRALAEVGTRRVFPLLPVRGSVRPRPGARDRWRRIAVEAAKQCGRNLLLETADPCTVQDLIPSLSDYPLRLMAHPDSEETLGEVLHSHGLIFPAMALVGPEGGFSPAEVGAAVAAGFRPVRLTASTLRVETAAIAIASALLLGGKPRA